VPCSTYNGECGVCDDTECLMCMGNMWLDANGQCCSQNSYCETCAADMQSCLTCPDETITIFGLTI